MSRVVLALVGVVLVLMGIAGLVPSWHIANEPAWLAIVKIILGLISVVATAMDKGKEIS